MSTNRTFANTLNQKPTSRKPKTDTSKVSIWDKMMKRCGK